MTKEEQIKKMEKMLEECLVSECFLCKHKVIKKKAFFFPDDAMKVELSIEGNPFIIYGLCPKCNTNLEKDKLITEKAKFLWFSHKEEK